MTPFTAAEERLVESARQFAAEALAPRAEEWERRAVVPDAELHRAAAKAGLTLLMNDPPHGPGRVRLPVVGRVGEALAEACMPFALLVLAHNYIGRFFGLGINHVSQQHDLDYRSPLNIEVQRSADTGALCDDARCAIEFLVWASRSDTQRDSVLRLGRAEKSDGTVSGCGTERSVLCTAVPYGDRFENTHFSSSALPLLKSLLRLRSIKSRHVSTFRSAEVR